MTVLSNGEVVPAELDDDGRQSVMEALADARAGLEQFRRAMADVSAVTRAQRRWLWERFDAYPGWRLDRDQGAGQSIDGWLDELEKEFEDAR